MKLKITLILILAIFVLGAIFVVLDVERHRSRERAILDGLVDLTKSPDFQRELRVVYSDIAISEAARASRSMKRTGLDFAELTIPEAYMTKMGAALNLDLPLPQFGIATFNKNDGLSHIVLGFGRYDFIYSDSVYHLRTLELGAVLFRNDHSIIIDACGQKEESREAQRGRKP